MKQIARKVFSRKTNIILLNLVFFVACLLTMYLGHFGNLLETSPPPAKEVFLIFYKLFLGLAEIAWFLFVALICLMFLLEI